MDIWKIGLIILSFIIFLCPAIKMVCNKIKYKNENMKIIFPSSKVVYGIIIAGSVIGIANLLMVIRVGAHTGNILCSMAVFMAVGMNMEHAYIGKSDKHAVIDGKTLTYAEVKRCGRKVDDTKFEVEMPKFRGYVYVRKGFNVKKIIE